MSAPAFAWAFEKGHELGLTSSQLVLLLYMADQANCVGSFFTGQPRLAKYTRMTERGVRKLIPQLEALGLIRVVSAPGKPTQYYILRQPVGAELGSAPARSSAQEQVSAQVSGSGGNGAAPRNPVPPHPGTSGQAPRNQRSPTPEPGSADPFLPKKSTQEEARNNISQEEKALPPPVPPLTAPVIGTTGGGGYITPTPARSSDDYLSNPSPDDALPKAEDELDVADRPVDPATALREFDRVKQALRSKNYPPRAATLTRDEQRDLCADKPRIKPLYLPDAVLRAQRAELAQQAMARGRAA